MVDQASTLGALFARVDSDRWRAGVAALEKSPALGGLAGKIAGKTDLMNWPAALGEIVTKAPALLQVDVVDVLVGAWKKGEELRRYADPSAYGPDETILVELTRHVVRSAHRPHLDIVINDTTVGHVDFEFEVALTLEGAVLEVRGGHLRGARTGACRASGEFSCEGISLIKKESEPFEIPGRLTFKRPIAIAPPADRDAPPPDPAAPPDGSLE